MGLYISRFTKFSTIFLTLLAEIYAHFLMSGPYFKSQQHRYSTSYSPTSVFLTRRISVHLVDVVSLLQARGGEGAATQYSAMSCSNMIDPGGGVVFHPHGNRSSCYHGNRITCPPPTVTGASLVARSCDDAPPLAPTPAYIYIHTNIHVCT